MTETWATPFAMFVDMWWYGLTFHVIMHLVFLPTGAGRWMKNVESRLMQTLLAVSLPDMGWSLDDIVHAVTISVGTDVAIIVAGGVAFLVARFGLRWLTMIAVDRMTRSRD